MKPHWELKDLHWDQLTPAMVSPALLQTVKTAALIEANSSDYVSYLHNVFAGDEAFRAAADRWGVEEAQHGNALGRWAELVDPTFDFTTELGDGLPKGDNVRGRIEVAGRQEPLNPQDLLAVVYIVLRRDKL